MTFDLTLALAAVQLNCEYPQTGSEMAECSFQQFKRADEKLNRQWHAVQIVMRERDKNIDFKTDRAPRGAETLLAAQRAWLTFRDEHCLLVSMEARGGNSTQLILLNACKEELTNLRTEQLQSLVK